MRLRRRSEEASGDEPKVQRGPFAAASHQHGFSAGAATVTCPLGCGWSSSGRRSELNEALTAHYREAHRSRRVRFRAPRR